MNNRDIDRFFEEQGLQGTIEKIVRPPNEMWHFRAAGLPILIQTQENANRMRIVAFIAEAAELQGGELLQMLQANYHTTLDARYAVTDDGHIVAAFLHPLAELSADQFADGLIQVFNCAVSFGTDYTAGSLIFGERHSQVTNGSTGRRLVRSIADLAKCIQR
ncbi:MAG: hypothetical protein KatS3mg105_0485 [Gemmatales bacterium]|nr:MAG: hypothetical protein KatS3mg105_0485 [Gemmatales bacterium]